MVEWLWAVSYTHLACIVTDTHIPIECENYLLDHGIEVKKVEN